MSKHPRKRQKTTNDASSIQRALLDDSSKDDEERRLENLLFGTKFVPSTQFHPVQDDGGSKALQNLTDTDLFYVDDGEPSMFGLQEDEDDNESVSETSSNHDDEEDSSGSSSDSHPDSDSDESVTHPPKARKPAWEDPSDPPVVSIESKRLLKLRDQPSETILTGRQYESRLRRQYERINPQPAWAKAAKERLRDTDGAGIDELLSSTSGILASRSKKVALPAGTLSIERLRDANQAASGSGCGEIKSLVFHPSAKVPVLCVGSADRRVRLFNIDGHTSPLLQTLHIPTLPLSQFSTNFHPSGASLLLTGARPFYFVYDLQRGEMQHKAGRGLWGSYDSTTSVSARKRGRVRSTAGPSQDAGGTAEGMEITAFNPSGDILAVAGRGGNVHLLDWKSGAGQVVGSLKCGANIKSLWWTGAGADGGDLAALTNDSEVFLWDVGERRCLRRWKDEGGFRGSGRAMTGSSSGWLAVGSNTGLVNVYGSDSFQHADFESFTAQPKPVKTIGHLTTAISTLRFNHDAQVMAVASREKKDAMRLIHLPTLTSFSNWPTSSTPLGHVSAIDFSAQSEYVAVGNTRGKVLLYHLIDYGAARVFM
ncbi:Methyltransf-2 domain-containing protein [Mycena sanguinolenta]|uniref:Methyltransf-2 domain-containing protein n=1 Tax=Mycena sanguinolenta TaxID=230812 RepID=A0A8H6ZCT6_9AGAR|nr:Methyltransf-2 domain-containing protein [Mycena sanguinolenta]